MASTRFFIFSSLLLSSLLFTSSAASLSSKVSVALYYESLCPYSANFIVNYVAKFFNNGLISFIDLELIPYGNARIKPNGTIICQHGPFECLLNTVEACAISVWPDLNQHFSFIYCVESLVMERKYIEWESCFQKTGLNSEAVLDCYENGKGEKDYEDVEAYICKAYEGKLPKACEELPLVITSEAKANRARHVSRVNEIITPLQLAQKHEV